MNPRTQETGSKDEAAGEPRQPADGAFPGADAFAKLWSDFAAKMTAAGMSFTPGAPPPDAARQVRAAMLKAMGEASDEFMRSPQFQEMMKQSLASSVQLRKQLNDFLGRMQHEFQGTSRQDVDSLMQVMEHVERRVTDSFERLSSRLDDIASRLERVEKSKPAAPEKVAVTTRTEKMNETDSRVWVEAQTALLDETFNNLRRAARLPLLWQQAQRVKKGATPAEVVYEEDTLKLLHYPSAEPRQFKTPLVFVFALVNRPYILDLLPGKSVIEHFVRAGFDTYLIDWGVPTHAHRHLTLDSYVNGYIQNVVDFVSERSGSPQVSILGYCMGGAMSAMFTALHPEKVKNLILLAAGIDFSTRDGLLNVWADPQTFDVDAFVDAFGNCPAEFLQAGFLMLKPISNFIEKPLNLLEHAEDERFVDEYFTMETWLNDNIPVPGEVYREFVKYLYQQNLLVKNQLPVGRHIVNLKRITCPVLNLMAVRDDLVPCAQSEPFNDLVGSTDRKSIKLPAGHIGLAVGSRAQRELWPPACEWLAQRSEPVQSTRRKTSRRK